MSDKKFLTNKDLPAYPVSEEETDRITDGITLFSGLTKLEAFTMAAMQGILGNRGMIDDVNARSSLWVSEKSLEVAIATLEALEKVK